MAQHAILRFEKHKGNPARPLEAHHERQKEQYASNPDIDTSRSKYNFHIVKPESRYYHFIQNRIEQAGCRTRKDSTRFVDTLITASPEFFKKKPPKEIQEFFHRAADFLIGRVGRENIVSAVVHMDEKTPHLHLVFVPLTEDNRLCAKEIIGNRANLSKWQDDFHAYMVEKYPDLERGESASKTGRKHIPTRLFKQAVNLSKQARAIEATLDGINPLNAGKKKEEALSMLKKWFPHIYSAMALRDDLLSGESYYIAEILATKRILDAAAAGEPVLCAVDEVLRGTNTLERISAASEILLSLASSGALVVAATHDLELCAILDGNYDMLHFEEEVTDEGMSFDYRVRPGRTLTRNAIRLLRLMGLDESITQRADKRARRFLETGIWEKGEI